MCRQIPWRKLQSEAVKVSAACPPLRLLDALHQVDVNDLYLLCRKEEWSNNGQVFDAHTVFML